MVSLGGRLSSLMGSEEEGGGEDDPDDQGDAWPYQWTETEVETVHGQPVLSHAADDDPESVFAGPLARQMIEGPRNNPDQPLYVGIGTRNGRHVGIERQYLFRHTCVFGVTGYGKSTLLKNSAKQVIESGHGCVFIDPKGQDSIELVQILPEDRLDDIVWIEPGQNRSAVAGFNFLEVGVDEDHPMYDAAVENVVDDLVDMVGLDDYWGPLMDGVCSNLIRGTTRLDRDFNLLDLYYILTDKDARSEYAQMLKAEGLTFLADYAGKIEQMDDEDLDALQRRFKDWTEDPLARSTVAHRDTDIDIESIVDEDKILIVRMAEQGEDLKEMIGTAILRRVWSSIRSRAATYDKEYDPFYLFADEFDLLATRDSSVTTMLSKARSLSLALFLCCQQPSQLPDDVVSAMYSNCDTVLSFSPGSPENAQAVAKNLDMDWSTLRRESNYHVWTQLTISETRERSEAFRTYTLPPFPPLRGEAEAIHTIERTVRETGREPLTDEEMRRGLILGEGSPEDFGDDPTDEDATDELRKAIYDAALRSDDADGGTDWVETDAVVDVFEQRHGDAYQSEVAAMAIDSEAIEFRDDADSTDHLRTPDTDPSTFAPVTGSGSEGGIPHWSILFDAYDELTALGLDIDFPEQGGEASDATGRLRVNWSSLSDAEAFREDNPVLAELTDGSDVTFEAEKATSRKGQRTLVNFEKALDTDRKCLFLCRPDAVSRLVTTLTDPPYVSEESDGERVFYNGRELTIGGDVMLRPARSDSCTWTEREDGSVVLSDTEGKLATFDSVDAVFSDVDAYPERAGTVDPDEVGPDGEWRNVMEPYIPEREIPSATQDDFEILSVDHDGSVERVVNGETVPLTETEDDDESDEDGDHWDRLERRSGN